MLCVDHRTIRLLHSLLIVWVHHSLAYEGEKEDTEAERAKDYSSDEAFFIWHPLPTASQRSEVT